MVMELDRALARAKERLQRGEVTGLSAQERRAGWHAVSAVGAAELAAAEPGAPSNARRTGNRSDLEGMIAQALVAQGVKGADAREACRNVLVVLTAQGVLRRSGYAKLADGDRSPRYQVDREQVERRSGLGGAFGPKPLSSFLSSDALEALLAESFDGPDAAN